MVNGKDIGKSIAILLVLNGAACATIPWTHVPYSPDEEKTLYVIRDGQHTGIVASEENLGYDLAFLKTAVGEAPYYEFGWGDSDFYQSEEISTGLTLKALFWPTSSVVKVAKLTDEPNANLPHDEVVPVRVSGTSHTLINREIAGSFKSSGEKGPKKTHVQKDGATTFFAGKGRYAITKTCNTWTARVLKSGGVPMRTFLTLTSGSVLRQIKRALKRYRCCRKEN